jgi:succinyl-CoA synthetase beta subunit
MLKLGSVEAVRAAFGAIMDRARTAHPGAAVDGMLVQRMAPPGLEVILGVSRDAAFGPMLMVGLGGIHVEVLRDVAFAPVPLMEVDARTLLAGLQGAKLLEGVRGAPPADVPELVALMVALGRFAADHADDIEEIDLNPVLVHPAGEGLSVVDALIIRRMQHDTA